MNKKTDLAAIMQQEMHKLSSAKQPDLLKAAECLHAAMEIFEETGFKSRADDVLSVLSKIAQHNKEKPLSKVVSLKSLMEAGITQHDLLEFSKGNPIAKAKLNLVLRDFGLSNNEISKYLGHTNLMSEEDAREMVNPNRSFSKIWKWIKDPISSVDSEKIQPGETIEMTSVASKKKSPNRPDKISDRHTKNLNSQKMVANLKNHGTVFNLADDGSANVDLDKVIKNITEQGGAFNMALNVPKSQSSDEEYKDWLKNTKKPEKLTENDVDPELSDLLHMESFDVDASDDELLNMEIKEDSLEVFDKNIPLEDFEDENN